MNGSSLTRWVPGVTLLRTRRGPGLRRDLIAGVALAALLVPQGMGYAQLAGLPPVTGLYATLVPLVAYFFIGPSRILIVSPDSAVAPLVAAAIIPLAGADADQRVAMAGLLALVVGAIMFAGGLARFGFVTELLSLPVRVGYLAGIALTVVISQLPKLFGFSIDTENVVAATRDFISQLDETNGTALAIGVGCLAVIGVLRAVAPKMPGVLIAVVGATAVVAVGGLADQLPVVGKVPAGLPPLDWPNVALDDIKTLLPAAVGIAFVAFADTSVLSRSYAARLDQHVDQNRELAALGASNIVTGFFQGFPISTSASRTAVVDDMGAGSQIAGLTGALVLGVLLVVGTGLVEDLPVSALAAVVIVAVLGLFDVGAARLLWRWRRTEFALCIATFAGVAAFGVLWGVGLAIALSLLNFVRRAWYPHGAVLGRVERLKGYHDTGRHPDARLIPGLVLYRFDAPLFFANADSFDARVRALAGGDGVAWVVIAAEPITDVDVTAGETLLTLHADLADHGVTLAFAELKDPVRDYLRRYGVEEAIGAPNFYPTLGVAVAAYVKQTGTHWVDWEERP
ncbi:SulP family inorganic anion transporter [Solirubrobacter soli]|uniref:SulP family inorganic anion transporter n=1 Tax=Solirubrobacter soli TaxID=363832 RepID=UPI00042A78E0|nr:SulP family inorganic anion transporter [Solirubrobacter soli]